MPLLDHDNPPFSNEFMCQISYWLLFEISSKPKLDNNKIKDRLVSLVQWFPHITIYNTYTYNTIIVLIGLTLHIKNYTFNNTYLHIVHALNKIND